MKKHDRFQRKEKSLIMNKDEKIIYLNNVEILKEVELKNTDIVKYHITYDEHLTIKELSEVLDVMNKSINDINRSNGIKNNAEIGKRFAPTVSNVENGSIIMDIIVNLVVPITTGIMANVLYDKLTNHFSTKTLKGIKVPKKGPSFKIVVDDKKIEIKINKK